jgi:membrane dipeptidase
MKTKLPILITVIVLLMAACQNKPAISKEEALMAKAKKIHQNVITLDTHNDINVKNFTDSLNYADDIDTQVNIPKMEKGGLDVTWLVVYTAQGALDAKGYADAYKNAMDKFKAIHRLTEKYAPDKIELALTSKDVRRIHKAGKKVAIIGVENAYSMGLDLSNVKKFHDLGARYMSLSHNGHSQFCDSHTGEKDSIWLYHGLSDLGLQALKEMNKWGIMADVSHPSKESFLDIIKYSKAPIIASHSAARALCNNSRNLDDEELKLLAKKGGVVQTVAFAGYLNADKDKAYKEAVKPLYDAIGKKMGTTLPDPSTMSTMTDAEFETFASNLRRIKKVADKDPRMAIIKQKTPPVNVQDLVNHIDYMVKLIGINHVGISSDFDGGGGIDGWSDASETFNVTLELVKRGYTEAQISKIWSGNLLRVLDDCQRIAERLQRR